MPVTFDHTLSQWCDSDEVVGDIECPWDGCYCTFDSGNECEDHQIESHGMRVDYIKRNCCSCGGVFETIDPYGNYVCSKDCWGQKTIEKYREDNDINSWLDSSDIVDVECDLCGSLFEYPTKADRMQFCSCTCRKGWELQNLDDDNDSLLRWPNRSEFRYGYNWSHNLKKDVRSRFYGSCADCGIHHDELEQSLDVHHVKKAKKIDNPEVRNDPDNLVPLCRECHEHWEEMTPFRPRVV